MTIKVNYTCDEEPATENHIKLLLHWKKIKESIFTTLIFISLNLYKGNFVINNTSTKKIWQNTDAYTGQSMRVTVKEIIYDVYDEN